MKEHPEETAIFGGYWDVYRLSFLTGGRVRGVPYPGSSDHPDSPDRFDEARNFPGYRPRILVARNSDHGAFYAPLALNQGAKLLHRTRSLMIIDWPPSP